MNTNPCITESEIADIENMNYVFPIDLVVKSLKKHRAKLTCWGTSSYRTAFTFKLPDGAVVNCRLKGYDTALTYFALRIHCEHEDKLYNQGSTDEYEFKYNPEDLLASVIRFAKQMIKDGGTKLKDGDSYN